jgi:hypothetical protein
MGDCFHLGEYKQRERSMMSKLEYYKCDFCLTRISGKVWEISETTHCCSSCEDTVGQCIDMISEIMRTAPGRYVEDHIQLLKDVHDEIS